MPRKPKMTTIRNQICTPSDTGDAQRIMHMMPRNWKEEEGRTGGESKVKKKYADHNKLSDDDDEEEEEEEE